MSERKDRLNRVLSAIESAARIHKVKPSMVTKAMLADQPDITEWDLRVVGGLEGIKRAHFPDTEKDLVQIRKNTETNKYVKELEKKLGDKELLKEQVLEAVQAAIKEVKWNKPKVSKPKAKKGKEARRKMTVELMLSDLHIGKKTPEFNLEVAKSRLKSLTEIFLVELQQNNEHFHIDQLILALIGDVVESYSFHGMESAKGCEFGNSEQMRQSIELLMEYVIDPIASLGVPTMVPCVPGNHDRTERERSMNKPGKEYMSWVIYHSLRMISEAKGYDHLTFIIPENSNLAINIYGTNILYEHGDNLKSTAKASLEKLMHDRSKQYGFPIDMMRSGHWHEYLCLGRGRVIINESLCGQDGYAETMGFNSHSGQTINFYVETKNRPNCFYKSFPVYLD
jgi:hypothetical protein